MSERKPRENRRKNDYLKYKDRDGRVADSRSLRHGFFTYPVTANLPPKVAQTLARNSTIAPTMVRYTHLGVTDLVDTLKRLPAISSGAENGRAMREAGVHRADLFVVFAGFNLRQDAGGRQRRPRAQATLRKLRGRMLSTYRTRVRVCRKRSSGRNRNGTPQLPLGAPYERICPLQPRPI